MAMNFASASSQDADVSAASITAYPLTISCWFNPVSTATTAVLVCLNATATQFELVIRPSAVLRMSAAGNVKDSAINIYSASLWQHACVVFTSTTQRDLYYNGTNVATDAVSAAFTTPTVTGVGSRFLPTPARNNFLNGAMCEVGIWNVALTTQEVSALAQGVPPSKIRPGSLQNYYHLWDATSPVPNFGKGGSTYNLTTQNTPTQTAHAPFILPDRR